MNGPDPDRDGNEQSDEPEVDWDRLIDQLLAFAKHNRLSNDLEPPLKPRTVRGLAEEGWPSTLDRLKLFPNWNRNLTLWEFNADS